MSLIPAEYGTGMADGAPGGAEAAAGWTEAVTLSGVAIRAFAEGDLDRSADVLDDQLGEARGDPAAELIALTSSALVRALCGRLARAREELAAAERRLRGLARPGFVPQWEHAALVCDWAAGDWTAAEARSARLAAMPPPPATITLALRIELLRQTGRREAAEQIAPRLAAQPPSALSAWALAGLDRGPGAALSRLGAAARSERRGMLPLVLCRMAEVAWAARDEKAATEACAGLRELNRDDPMARVLGGLTRAYATREPEPARAVQEIAETEGMAALTAECLTVRGRLGDRTLRAARDRWHEIGARRRADELTGLLDEPVPADSPARLTVRERELAGLVRTGRTNREIAATMYLSVKTVEAYLTRIYAKTDCASRLELALAITQGRIPL